MKLRTTLALIGLIAINGLTLNARDLYRLSWKGRCYTTDANGKVVAARYSQKDIIAKCAADNGISDTRNLALVYVANEQDIEVIDTTTGETICEILQLEVKQVEVASSDGTQVRRQAFIFNEQHAEALGSIFGSETSRRDANDNLVRFTYRGNFVFAIPEDGKVCAGTFSTGKRIADAANP
jgi:hypothetical protein